MSNSNLFTPLNTSAISEFQTGALLKIIVLAEGKVPLLDGKDVCV
jgi:hypothetical protein